MSVMIDEVSAEVTNASGATSAEEEPRSESAGRNDRESEMMLYDQIHRLEKRQLRLLAD